MLDERREHLFVGRKTELARLETLLHADTTERVALVHGPGGIGKTELARALVRRASRRVRWFDCKALESPDSLMCALSGASLDGALVVFDGFESVVDGEG